MFRSTGFALALVAGSVAAGELTDCFNDEPDADSRYTSTQPEVPRVSDADIAWMLQQIREGEKRALAKGDADDSPRISLAGETPPSD